jgi:alkylation response protein AidB-like acyl-CoA dehydrogenase
MTTLEDIRTDSLLDRAAAVAPVLAQHASRHDVEGTFVSESLDALRDSGLLAAAVPTELGGLGATNRDLADLQRELAHHCGATALALPARAPRGRGDAAPRGRGGHRPGVHRRR